MDKSRKYLDRDEAFFLLNHDVLSNKLGKATPWPANFPLCEMDLPSGESYTVGTYRSAITKETYSWHYNSNGVHWIKRVNADTTCQVVYVGCLDVSAEPRHAMTQFRAFMKVDKLCANVHGKQLIWTYGVGPIYQLDVEASIATNYFNTPFFSRCGDYCALVRMCVPDPCGCIMAEFLPLPDEDKGKSNNLIDNAFQYAFQHIYYDGRESIWSEPSTTYFQDSHGCFDNTDTFSRCMKLRIPIGNPMVDKIRIAYKSANAWYLTDTIDKYKKYQSNQQYWFERELSETITGNGFSEDDCSFDYIFCNDKQCDAIDANEISRVFNPIPRDVQALMPIGLDTNDLPALGAVNYVQGNCPIDKKEIQKLDIQLNCEEKSGCTTEYATVTVRAVIHNFKHSRNQFIYRLGGDNANSPDDTSDTAWFGGLNPGVDGGFETGYDQNFVDKTRNFNVYVEGTDFWQTMTQNKAHAFFRQLELNWGVVANMDDVNERNRWRRATRNGEFFYQEAKIKVLKGTRGFLRLTSHKATGNEPNTSTFVVGVLNGISLYKGDHSNVQDISNMATEEIFFDTCNGDVVLDKAFLIEDNATDEALETKNSAYNGYVKDNNGNPVEGAVISDGAFVNCTTDHNGFFHFTISPGTKNPVNVLVKVERDCFSFNSIKTESIASEPGKNQQHNITIEDDAWTNNLYSEVKVDIKSCQGVDVSGVRVALSGTKYKSSGADGIATFKIRNYIGRSRQLQAIVMNNEGCISQDCDGKCVPCMQTLSGAAPTCFKDKPVVNLGTVLLNISSTSERGLKPGGRYPFGAVVRFGCGKISAVNEVKYLDIPRVQEVGDGFCPFRYDGNGLVLPEDAECLMIVRGENVNSFLLQWVVDKIERVDNKIKLTIQSLNDYNEKYFFKSNTIYQWLAGDRVEFVRNGDGSIFTVGQHGLLNYLSISPFHDMKISGLTTDTTPANYFNQLLIEDDGKLDSLTEGAIIELHRGKACTTSPTYFGICVSIPIVNGKLLNDQGTFTTFDTFYVHRTIGKLPVQRFEHFAPSDFWGASFDDQGRSSVDDLGRPYFVNKFENERRYNRSMSINSPEIFNRFGDLVKTFNQALHGDITAIRLVDDQIGLCISEHDNSLFQVGGDLLQAGGDGIVRAVGADHVISNPQAKLLGEYGCRYDDIGSIIFGDGFVSWWDVAKSSIVVHNYRQATAIDDDIFKSYIRKRSTEIDSWNRAHADPLNKLRIISGLNYATGAMIMTVKALRDGGVNNQPAPLQQPNETFVFTPKDFLTFASFTAEAYGYIEGNNCALVAYLNSVPYLHPITSDKFNEFFGVPCDWYVGIAINENPKKRRQALSVELQSDVLWFATAVETDNQTFRSEIPPARCQVNRGRVNAAFLGNINSREGLYGDDKPFGYWVSAVFCRDNTQGLKYNSIDNSKRVLYSELDEIITKSRMIEQTGFDANL